MFLTCQKVFSEKKPSENLDKKRKLIAKFKILIHTKEDSKLSVVDVVVGNEVVPYRVSPLKSIFHRLTSVMKHLKPFRESVDP